MKQVRKMSNLVAEELQSALDAKGIKLDESAFEEKVSEIVSDIYEAVEVDDEEEVEEGVITEDDKFYYATSECSLGGIGVKEGEYVELEDTEDGTVATIYDEDGNVRESDIVVGEDDDFEDALEELEEDEEDEEVEESAEDDTEEEDENDDVDEASVKKFKVHNGKKVKLTANQIKRNKLKARGKLKKGYKFVDGKQVKMSAAEKKARKMAGKRLARKGKAARKKSMKKARQLAAGSTSGTVTEAFDIKTNDMILTVQEGDTVVMEDGTITVIREGATVMKGIKVSEGFMDRCFESAVMEADDVDDEDIEESADEEDEEDASECGDGKKCDEGEGCEDCDEDEKEEKADEAYLTFKANKGYVLVREGKELAMGNRVRSRGVLVSEGYNVSASQFDKASTGKMVLL